MNILIIEDEARVADFLQRGFAAEGWSATIASDGEQGYELAVSGDYDAILLDLMLPKLSGQEVCARLRAQRVLTPILMLTANDGVDDRVEGLRLGADDYVAKPFSFDELVARISAQVRRAAQFSVTADPELRVGALVLNRQSLLVTRDGASIQLTAKERQLLEFFLSRVDVALSRERILSAVWGTTEDPLTNVVDVYVARLRRKLGPDGGSVLETVRGTGYRLNSKSLQGAQLSDQTEGAAN
ncbi:MAG: response regulator transcription factor [Hyphomicrobiaceae bacterium]|nr:response regulator transcription factor [Hyphomicrobiaceae bacterium]